jgi:hypothetical protein
VCLRHPGIKKIETRKPNKTAAARAGSGTSEGRSLHLEAKLVKSLAPGGTRWPQAKKERLGTTPHVAETLKAAQKAKLAKKARAVAAERTRIAAQEKAKAVRRREEFAALRNAAQRQ